MDGTRKQAYKYVDLILRNLPEIKKAVDLEKKYHDSGNHDRLAGIRSGGVSSPTENLALADLTPVKRITLRSGHIIRRPEDWLSAVSAVDAVVDDKIPLFYYHGISIDKITDMFKVSRRTAYNAISDYRAFVVEAAIQKDLIKVF